MFRKLIGAIVGLAMMGMAGTANAIPIEMSFAATDFSGGAAPVSGAFTWDAASTTATIDSLLSVSLTIAGHTYTLGEVGFISPIDASLGDTIGGVINGVCCIGGGTDDFTIDWDRESGDPNTFTYIFLGLEDFPSSNTFSSFSITATEIPEPSTLALFATGLALLAFMGWRRRGSVQVKAA